MRKAWYALGAAMLLVVALASTAAATPDQKGARGGKYKSYSDNLRARTPRSRTSSASRR